MQQVLQLFNITGELSGFLTRLLNGTTTQNVLNSDYPEAQIDYNGNSAVLQSILKTLFSNNNNPKRLHHKTQ